MFKELAVRVCLFACFKVLLCAAGRGSLCSGFILICKYHLVCTLNACMYLCCCYCVLFVFVCVFVSGAIQNCSRGVQAKEAKGSTGLFHIAAGGVLLGPPRCCWCVPICRHFRIALYLLLLQQLTREFKLPPKIVTVTD